MANRTTYPLICLFILAYHLFTPNAHSQERTFFRQGYTVPLYSYNFGVPESARRSSLERAQATGANAIIFDFQLEQANLNASEVVPQHNIDRLMEEVALAKSMGIYTLIKPIVMIGSNGVNWQRMNPSDPDLWFETFGDKILSILNRDDASNIDAIIIGNELKSMSNNGNYQDDWYKLIREIRAVFEGEVGYNAGAFLGYFRPQEEEYLHVTFKDSLDFMGFSAYPRLIKTQGGFSEDPQAAGYDEYFNGWSSAQHQRNYKQEVIDFINDNPNLDIYFTELGSPACDGGRYNFPCANTMDYDLEQHAAFYEASLDILSEIENLKGIFIYNWMANTSGLGFNRGEGPYTWNIQGKAAETAITNGFWDMPPQIFELNVENGSGDGTYAIGEEVTIIADPAPEGTIFNRWVEDTDNVADASKDTTTIIIPTFNTTVTATYTDTSGRTNLLLNGDFEAEDLSPWTFLTNSSDASASIIDGEAVVDITMAGENAWQPTIFQTDVSIVNGVTYTIKMDARAAANRSIIIGMNDGAPNYQLLTIFNQDITTEMTTYEFTYEADRTDSDIHFFINIGGNNNNVILDNVVMESEFPSYALSVENGSGDGTYQAGEIVTIIADNAPEGMEFDQWTGDVDNVADVSLDSTTFVMPASNAIITATYKNIAGNNLFVNGDFESGDLSPWVFSANTADASASIIDGEAVVDIVVAGANAWQPSIFQTDLPIEEGVTYTIKMDARAAAGRSVVIGMNDGAPNNELLTIFNQELTTEMTTYEFTYESDRTDEDVHFFINMGSDNNNVILDNLVMEKTVSTSTKETDAAPSKLQIYPNPTDGIFSVEYEDHYSIRIYDSRGVLVKVQEGLLGNQQINLRDMKKGSYFIVCDNGEKISTEIIVLQ